MKTPQIGLDTLHLSPLDYELSPDFAPRRKFADATGDAETGSNYPLYRLPSGRVFEGVKAYLNEELFTLELFPFVDGKTGTNHVAAKVQLTVPKIVGADNYQPADCETVREALKMAERALSETGFKTDLTAALVKRCDIAKTIQLRDKWQTYLPPLDVFNPSRMPGVGFETGKRWGNTRRQICMYEKGLEIASHFPRKERAAVYARYPRNSARAEMRLTEKDSFREATGMETAGDVVSNFDCIERTYRSEFESKLFRFTPSEVAKMKAEALSVEDLAAEMLGFIRANERFWFREWEHADWVKNRVQNADRLKAIKAAVRLASETAGLASQNISKQEKRLDSLFLEHAAPVQSRYTVAELYRELQTKILE